MELPAGAAGSLLRAFREHDLVALGEPHESQDLADFLAALIREPAFAATVNDIVVECGNSAYQQLVDRFVSGEEVPPADLLAVWRNTTQPGAWDSPMYGQLLVRVRDVNRTLEPDRRLRIVLADPPIDWSRIHSGADLAPFAAVREAHFAAILEAQVLRKGRKALFWAGSSHVVRKPESVPNPIVLLERRGIADAWVVLVHGGFASDELEARLASWPVPSLLLVENSWLGHLDAARYFHNLKGVGRANPYAGVRLADAADGYLYLGRKDALAWAPPPEDIYSGEYGAEVRRRRQLIEELARLFRRPAGL